MKKMKKTVRWAEEAQRCPECGLYARAFLGDPQAAAAEMRRRGWGVRLQARPGSQAGVWVWRKGEGFTIVKSFPGGSMPCLYLCPRCGAEMRTKRKAKKAA